MRGDKFQEDAVSAYTQNALNALSSLPGVSRVASGLYVPVGGGGYQSWQKFHVAGQEPQYEHGIGQIVSAGYFGTLEIPLRAGRLFTDTDDKRASPVAIVNERFARNRFGDPARAVGQRFHVEDDKTEREIVGVVGDIKTGLPSEPSPPQVFLPERQNPVPFLALFARTVQDPALLVPAFERRMLEINKDLPAYRIRPVERVLATTLSGKRFLTGLMSGFAASAVLLAIVGLYGVLAYAVAQRTREFGVKLALGARSSHVIWDVLGRGLRMLSVGVIAGLAGALAVSRLLGGFLYRVSPHDASVMILVPGLILLAGLLGCWMPARRAGAIDPAAALRVE